MHNFNKTIYSLREPDGPNGPPGNTYQTAFLSKVRYGYDCLHCSCGITDGEEEKAEIE